MSIFQDGLRTLQRIVIKAARTDEEHKRIRNKHKRAKWRAKRRKGLLPKKEA